MTEFAYRAKRGDGTTVAGIVTAESRGAALRSLRRDRLVVVTLRPSGGGAAAVRGNGGRWMSIALAVLAVAAIVFMVFGTRRDGSPSGTTTTRRTAVKNPRGSGARPTGGSIPVAKAPGAVHGERAEEEGGGPEKPAVRPEPPAKSRVGETAAEDGEVPPAPEPPPKAFKTGAEQLLAMVIPASPGAPVPPLPALTEEGLSNDLARALRTEIVIGTNDTEETAALKEGVAALKAQYHELRNTEGWNFTEYLDAMRAQGEEDAAILSAARRELRELWKDRNVSDAEYLRRVDEINAILKERGLPEL